MQGIPAGFALTAIANYLIAKGVSALTIGSFDAIIGILVLTGFTHNAINQGTGSNRPKSV